MNKTVIYYCKSLKKTGKPIIISDGKTEYNTNKFNIKCPCCDTLVASMSFSNAEKKAKRRGANTVLEVYK